MSYNKRHGGPFEMGGADYWYARGFEPQYYTGASIVTDRVEMADMTPAEIAEYTAGYREMEAQGDQKEWGE